MVDIGQLREALLDANRGCKLHRVHVDALLACLDALEQADRDLEKESAKAKRKRPARTEEIP